MPLTRVTNSPGYIVRPADFRELSRLQDIERAASALFEGTKYKFLAGAEPSHLELLAAQQAAGLVWVVADRNDEPVGFAAAGFVDGLPHLYEIDVDPAHARKGLGTRLVQEVIDWARRSGHPQITLSTFRQVPWNAPFYRRFHFEELEESELSGGLLELREIERRLGLPVEERVCMRLNL